MCGVQREKKSSAAGSGGEGAEAGSGGEGAEAGSVQPPPTRSQVATASDAGVLDTYLRIVQKQ